MNLFELFVKIGAKDEASDKIKGIGKLASGLGKGLATAAKISGVAISAAATGIAALTTAAVNNYAEYEQLVGGAQLMFGNAYETVAKNAQDAYKTVQMSQNEYLQQVNGFATGLKTALSGNEQAAAGLAHRIVQAEADIVAATGNTQENVANAFNGIMKSNFTMLDNLQIGITPTKEGFQEVIDKVNEWNKTNGEATNYQMGNLADMQSALVDYIDMVGMSGYAQREASETITGSLSSMKAAWTNLVTGFADDSADLDKLIGNLTDSVVGYTDESGKQVKGVLDNLLPAIEKSLGGIAKLIEGSAPKIIEILPRLVERVVPSVISAATGMVNAVVKVVPDLLNTVVDAIINNATALIDSASFLVVELANGILKQLPKIAKLGLDLIVSLATGISENLDTLTPAIIDTILKIVETLTNPENLTMLLNAAIAILTAIGNYLLQPETINMLLNAAIGVVNNLVTFLIENLSPLFNAAIDIIMALVNYILDPDNLAKLVKTAIELVVTIAGALVGAVGELVKAAGQLILKIIEKFRETDWAELGKNLVDGFKKGIQNAWTNLETWFKNLFGDLVGIAKKILGIASPSKVFKKIGGFTAEGFGAGFEDEFAHVRDDMEKAMTFDDMAVDIGHSVRRVGGVYRNAYASGYGGTQDVNVNVTIDENVNAMGLARELLPYLKIAAQEAYA